MKRTPLSIPEIAIIGGTRAALGAGVGLLLANRLDSGQRRAVGWTLLAVGVLTTIPIVTEIARYREPPAEARLGGERRREPEYAV